MCLKEKMQTQYSVLGYGIDLYFHDYRLAIEFNEKGHEEIDNHEIEKQKATEKELGSEFVKIDPDKIFVSIFKAVNEMHRHIIKSFKESTKKSLIDNLSKSLLKLKF